MTKGETMAKEKEEHLLPNRLAGGDLLKSASGVLFQITTTGKRDNEGEPQYRLRYMLHRHRSRTLWTRDQLQAAGVRMLNEAGTA